MLWVFAFGPSRGCRTLEPGPIRGLKMFLLDRSKSPMMVGAGLAALLSTAVSCETLGQSDLDNQLESSGWKVERDSTGAMTLYAKEGVSKEDVSNEKGGVSKPQQSAHASRSEARDQITELQEELKARGWSVKTDEEGNTLLFPLKSRSESADEVAGSPPDPLERLRAHLQGRGWSVSRDSEGNTLLKPLRKQLPEEVVAKAGDSVATPATAPMIPTMLLRQALKRRGWTVEQAPDGALIATPDIQQAPVYPVKLPVDSLDKARQIARNWLSRLGNTTLAVDEVQQVKRIHVVNIVDKGAPHTLRNQLVIRNRDGMYVAVD